MPRYDLACCSHFHRNATPMYWKHWLISDRYISMISAVEFRNCDQLGQFYTRYSWCISDKTPAKSGGSVLNTHKGLINQTPWSKSLMVLSLVCFIHQKTDFIWFIFEHSKIVVQENTEIATHVSIHVYVVMILRNVGFIYPQESLTKN